MTNTGVSGERTGPEIWLPPTSGPEVLPNTNKREALVQLSDTFSDVWTPPGAPPIPDFDSRLTGQVRNNGRFSDLESPVGLWPEAASYGGVLLAELREEQVRLLDTYATAGRQHLPDAQTLRTSLASSVIGVLNSAPRTDRHKEAGQNGDDFYLAELDNNLQLFAQLPFLRGVASRGLIRELWRIKDDNPVWPKGEQFRSSIVSQLRNFPEALEAVDLSELPQEVHEKIFLAYADKYGNGRLEIGGSAEIPDPGEFDKLQIKVESEEIIARGASKLPEIPEGDIGVYINPADREATEDEPRYLEIARKVANPNNPGNSAYEALRRAATKGDGHPKWPEVEIQINA